ncbi:DUF3284 domain-containing protein [Vagococcus acidifermentans]|uniref:DUF3284 domain-containing protein n=1 Tax=Vagococcus acidifermentans TaxID=564710 RepID=A0A430AQ28_9ENTE|nr:DUF3284 domain-containing protein [Vagococcus acidifermentans]RSU10228.1 hypothetical protein CBF27_10805 [Vagococcus acidifermentans]
MEIVKQLNVPATFFYEKIIDSVIFDIRKQTGKKVTRQNLTNFEYIKTFSKNSQAKIKIEKHVENRAYHFRTSTTHNDYLVQYDIKPLDDHSCEVVYRESMTSYGFLQKMNDAVMGTLLGFFKKRRFIKMLDMIEAAY